MGNGNSKFSAWGNWYKIDQPNYDGSFMEYDQLPVEENFQENYNLSEQEESLEVINTLETDSVHEESVNSENIDQIIDQSTESSNNNAIASSPTQKCDRPNHPQKRDRQINLLSPFNMSINIKIFKSFEDFYTKFL